MQFLFLLWRTSRVTKDHFSSTAAIFWFSLPILFTLVVFIYYYLKWKQINIFKLFLYLKPLPDEHKEILRKKNLFYKKLSTEYKSKFEQRVNHFLINKNIIDESGNDVSDEKKVTIAATFIQLTIGLRPVFLSNFNTITVSQKKSDWGLKKGNKKVFKLSWTEFELGISNISDGYNPGLQLMAEALFEENLLETTGAAIFGESAFRKWQTISKKQADFFINTGLSQFKSYREVNKEKYFGASVVYFFEKPQDFKQRFPDMYKAMKGLLNQDTVKNRII
ncbi:MAG: zinc-dependent peptidase [Sporocytophaga sp.]|uniref:zinc-dependent peptidase n=1 Tax=Sporocytophaga sp. TaxID=2231183 RepID=UPI001B138FE2|nr:zinc-dependent peptidase [Sporocytophaga sp.]MBO9701132.1 zinc-dependent peptidase [Sporocytophaga sp.]